MEKVFALFEIKKNQLKMVRRRGYNIDKEAGLLTISKEEFHDAYVPFAEQSKKSIRAVLTQVYEKNLTDEDQKAGKRAEKLYVYFADIPETSQLGVDAVSNFIQEMDKFRSKNGILITPRDLSPTAKKNIEGLLSYNISVFSEQEMSYDPIEHFLTPEHIGMTPEAQRDFLKRNNVSIDQLPVILVTDIITRYYGFKLGEVVEIKRVNMYDSMIQDSLSFRVVREDIY